MMNAYEKAKQLTAKWEQERKDSKRLATMKEAERRIQVRSSTTCFAYHWMEYQCSR